MLLALVLAVVATSVQSDSSNQGSLIRSHHRMIKKVVPSSQDTLKRRTEEEDCPGSHEWGSSSEWSNEKHHHHHPHKHHHEHHHHYHHKDRNEEGKNDHEAANKDDKPQPNSTEQKPPAHKEESKSSSEHKDKHEATDYGGGGLIGKPFPGQCPDPKATQDHPNGCIEFLNCNINNGWKPPHVEISQLKVASPDEVVKGNVFKPCAKYLDHFKGVSSESGIPTIILMSIAMQESNCDAGMTGPNGEISLMQIIPENCNGNCWDVYNNIHLGAVELQKELKKSGGNFLQAMGEVSD